MKVCVIGTGYVGLVSGVCFAEIGNTVFCVDKDKEKIELLKAGKVPISEEGLTELIKRNNENGNLVFNSDTGNAIKKSEIIFIGEA